MADPTDTPAGAPVALVTGASRGLGLALAEALAERGWRLVIDARGADALREAARPLGGGIRGGITHGATDDLGYNAVDDVVHVHDLHATMLHLLGVDHRRLTYKFQGRDFRLTDVHGHVVKKILS